MIPSFKLQTEISTVVDDSGVEHLSSMTVIKVNDVPIGLVDSLKLVCQKDQVLPEIELRLHEGFEEKAEEYKALLEKCPYITLRK